METAFEYSAQVTGTNFLGRKDDVAIIGNMMVQGESLALYAPPKSGKTSLIQQSLLELRKNGRSFMAANVDMLPVREDADFFIAFGNAVMGLLGVSPEEYSQFMFQYFHGTHFVFDKAAYQDRGAIVSVNWDLDDKDFETMLRFPFHYCRDNHANLVLILEEFQNVRMLPSGDKICALLGNIIREFKPRKTDSPCCNIIFSGSMVNAMENIFRRNLWFHRIVECVQMRPVDEKDIVDYVYRRLSFTGKEIDRSLLLGVCRLFRCNVWYINHFVSICDYLARGYIVENVMTEGLKSLISVHSPRFFSIVEDLTTHQVNFLKATLQGHRRFSSSEIIKQYKLNSSANVRRVKEALMKKEILVFDDKDDPIFQDPLFEYWMRKYYFGLEN